MDIAYYKELYSNEDIRTMQLSAKALLPGKNRIEEIVQYAKNAGIRRIGIANCISLQKEANILTERLQKDFEVFSVNCRIGKVPSSELIDSDAKGLSCNPAGQADFLASQQTEINIAVGLCIGHDLIFSEKSAVPVTTLIVKDREHKHNPLKELEENI